MHSEYECLLRPCAMMGRHVPPLAREQGFFAIANFFFAAHALGLVAWSASRVISPAELRASAQRFCALPAAAVRQRDVDARAWNLRRRTCFSATLVSEQLRAFGFADDSTQVTFAREIAGQKIDWTLGSLLYDTQYMPEDLESTSHEPQRPASAGIAFRGASAAAGSVDAEPPRRALAAAMLASLALGVAFALGQSCRRRGSYEEIDVDSS
eukprot:TRINITY_DN17479_c0_g1_i1.p1 TRINITY_DN17479_c0_g1~~TRINITY_DN17479_c0_g1_i1.p1  ORF type:complete len:211 (-),score=56.67 TRINITY_DN17479_c0_g1_i1:2-634(-)